MSGVDDRIVSMKFDNAAFERKLTDTISSLDKLRTSLDFSNSTKGFENITSAANSVSLSHIAEATEGIASKFSVMTAVATAAIGRLTMRAVDAGLTFAKSFTVAPIMDGFREMETKMGSIQTILANTQSKGTTLTQVTDSLDELNHYADKTIYNFGEMTKSVGLFTNAGLGVEEATSMIKGFSNAAAASGATAEATARAQYQLSQALSVGEIRLMDWKSLSNAGMGNELMKQGLVDIAGAMGSFSDTGTDGVAAMQDFNGSLEKGWLKTDVMSQYLKIMAGEMDGAQMAALGLSEAQIASFTQQAKTAEDAATKVRTFTQLIGTTKEAIGSGWAETFTLVFGDFNQATELFTDINNAVSSFIGRVSDARNNLLKGWSDFGGRTALITGLKNVFSALGNVLTQIKDAFREFFPPTTVADLLYMTASFVEFTEKLKMGGDALDGVKNIFRAVFSTLQIGWEVLKGVAGLIGDVVSAIVGPLGGGAFSVIGEGAGALADFNAAILDGGGIPDFFEKLGGFIRDAGDHIQNFKDKVIGIFTGFSGSEAVEETAGKVTESLGLLGGAAEFVKDAFGYMIDRFKGIGSALSDVWDTISEFLGGIGDKLANMISPGDFDHAVDAVNVGLLGGIMIILKKFLDGGLKIDFSGGLFNSIKKSFDTLTGTLKSMQAQLKAKALMKIAEAIAILTAALVVLSMIDSDKLMKALAAMSVGFGQLVGVMALMDKMTGMSSMKMNGLALSMNLMATAIGILSMAVTNFSQLDTGALIKGLGGVAAGMTIMVAAMNLMQQSTPGMIKASIAMGAVGVALLVMSKVVTTFSEMSLKEMGQGLLGVGAAMMIIAVGMKAIDTKATLGSGLAMLALAFSLKNMADAVQAFANIPWSDIAKGTASITILLLALSSALRSMPKNLAASAAGLVLISGALVIMGEAVKVMGAIKMGDLAKGLGAITLLLIELSVALNVMNGTAAGAASLLVASGALLVLSGVLKVLGSMSLGEIMKSLIALGGALAIIGVAAVALTATGATAALMALGVAIGLVGGGIALIGGGVFLLAKGFEVLAKSGAEGAKAFVEAMKVFVGALPSLIGTFIKSLAEMAKQIISVVPLFLEAFRIVLGKILDVIIELSPKVAKALEAILLSGLELIKAVIPKLVETGFAILGALLEGILSNTAGITLAVIEIFAKFATAVMDNMATIVAAAAGIILSFVSEIANHAADFISAGLDLLVNLLLGISNNIGKVVTGVLQIITTILSELANAYSKFIAAGLSILEKLISGVINNISKIVTMVVTIVTKFVETLGENAFKIIDAGFKLLTDFIGGILDNIIKITEMVGDLVTRFVGALAENAQEFIDAGADLIVQLLKGLEQNTQDVIDAGGDFIITLISGLATKAGEIAMATGKAILDLLDGIDKAITTYEEPIIDKGLKIAGHIITGMINGLKDSDLIKKVVDAAVDVAKDAFNAVKRFLHIDSPSKLFIDIGQYMVAGMAVGLDDSTPAVDSAENLSSNVVDIFKNTLSKVSESLEGIDEFQPVIAPVLDLTKVRAQARGLQGLVDTAPSITPNVSFERARVISTSAEMAREAAASATQEPAYTGPTEVNFNQTINAPLPLSTNDIYRNTKSQLAMAKEELEIA